jgi:hypothetical protein
MLRKWLGKFLHDYSVGLAVAVTGVVVVGILARYHSYLDSAKRAKVKLDPQAAFVAALPWWLIDILVVLVLVLFALLILRLSEKREPKSVRSRPLDEREGQAETQYISKILQEELERERGKNLTAKSDLGRCNAERDALQSRLDDRFPKFVASLWQIDLEDPPHGPDLRAFLIIQIQNLGVQSCCITGWKVSVKAVNGAAIDAEVFYADEFKLITNKFNSQIRYKAEHYITTRTARTPIVRGTPVDGALPVLFKGTTDIDKINWASLKISFADAIGNRASDGPQWWETGPIESIRMEDIMIPKKRIGLPVLEPRTLL